MPKRRQRHIPQVTQKPQTRIGMSEGMAMALNKAKETKSVVRFAPPALMPGVVPEGQVSGIAMDSCPGAYEYANSAWAMDRGSLFQPFPGYPYLAGLSTRPEYRQFAETLSSEMTREWIEFAGASGSEADPEVAQDKARISELEEAIEKFDLRGVFKRVVTHDALFGRGQISINLKNADDSLPLVLAPQTIEKGSLQSFKTIEAMWTTPNAYNAIDPTAPDFYKPRSWFVLGKQVHATRLLTIITREMPDMLKPAYNFGGMSISQLAQDYVDNWRRTRQAVSDLVDKFSQTILATNMGQVLQGSCDGSDLFARVDFYTATRSNRGMAVIDKDSEEIVQVNTPLSGLSDLQSQALEQMCVVSKIPAMILTGISPSGLNASSEGEIRAFYDWISSQQEAYLLKPLDTCIKVLMLNLWGEIDETITFKFKPLWQTSPKEQSEIRVNNANALGTLSDRGFISQEEGRAVLAADPDSGFAGIDIEEVPEMPMEEGVGGGFGGFGVDPAGEGAEDKSVSEAQHRAMAAAAEGHGTLGIPASVGKEFVEKDKE